MSSIKHLRHDPVWVKIIAGGVVVLFATYYLDWWPATGIGIVLKFLGASSSLPNWVLGVLWFSFLSLAVSIGVFLWMVLASRSKPPEWQSYGSDDFLGVRWRWHYDAVDQVTGLHSFCPECNFQVFLKDGSAEGTIVRCETCRRDLAAFDEPPAAIESKIERFIQQKILNGTWTAPNRT
jgi:hypothetical protein